MKREVATIKRDCGRKGLLQCAGMAERNAYFFKVILKIAIGWVGMGRYGLLVSGGHRDESCSASKRREVAIETKEKL